MKHPEHSHQRHAPTGGHAGMAAAWEILRSEWHRGARHRELALQLMFLSWYLLLEPEHLTGLVRQRLPAGELEAVFNTVHDFMAPAESGDAELLYVTGLMAHLAPWLLGDHTTWEQRSHQYRQLYRSLEPDGINPAVFDELSYYGAYFASQAGVAGGY